MEALPVGDLLLELRSRGLPLLLNGQGQARIWGPNTRVSRALRSATRAHNQELVRCVLDADVWACPSPGLHRVEWTYQWDDATMRYRCPVCERLQAVIDIGGATVAQKTNKNAHRGLSA